LSGQTIPQWLDATAERYPQGLACVFREPSIRWTWQQLRDESLKLACGLHALGLRQGERIGIWSPNRPEWVLTQYAAARLGLVLVNINPAYRLAELEYALNKAGCKAVISAPAFKTSQYLQMLQTLAPELAHCAPGQLQAARLPQLRWVCSVGAGVEKLLLPELPASVRVSRIIDAEQADGIAQLRTTGADFFLGRTAVATRSASVSRSTSATIQRICFRSMDRSAGIMRSGRHLHPPLVCWPVSFAGRQQQP
jgi:acyl-CoA synthetase (AMP-forming)/AMP-acid ligase II